MADLYVNGEAMSSLNWWLEMSDSGRTQQPQWIESGLWSRRGIMASGVRSFGRRTITLHGAMVTAANTVQGRVTAEDLLADRLGGGLVTIRLDDGTTPAREIDALLTDLEFKRVGHPLLAVKSEAAATFLCPDGDWRAIAGTAIRLTSTYRELPLGTAPSVPIIRVAGSATNPIIYYAANNGQVIASISVTVSLSSSEYMDVDMGAATIVKYSGGSGSSLISASSVGDLFPFSLDPQHGSFAASKWPMLRVTSGTSEVLYTKRYR